MRLFVPLVSMRGDSGLVCGDSSDQIADIVEKQIRQELLKLACGM